MTRMTKEEKELRAFIRAAIQNDCDKPTAMEMIRDFRRAVEEECAKVCEREANSRGYPDAFMCHRMATAIRKGGR